MASIKRTKRLRKHSKQQVSEKNIWAGVDGQQWLTDWRRSTLLEKSRRHKCAPVWAVGVCGGRDACWRCHDTQRDVMRTVCVCNRERRGSVCCDVCESTERWMTAALLRESPAETSPQTLQDTTDTHRDSTKPLHTRTQMHLWTPDTLAVHAGSFKRLRPIVWIMEAHFWDRIKKKGNCYCFSHNAEKNKIWIYLLKSTSTSKNVFFIQPQNKYKKIWLTFYLNINFFFF